VATGVSSKASAWCVIALATACVAPASAADGVRPMPDPLAQSVLDSLAFPPRTTPPSLLDAAIRAADVEAYDVSARYLSALAGLLEKAGDKRFDLLADLGDTADPASLRRLERVLGDRDEDVRPIVQAMREAARERRRDPARLTQAGDDLSSDKPATRAAAFDQLARAGVDALPVLVNLLQPSLLGFNLQIQHRWYSNEKVLPFRQFPQNYSALRRPRQLARRSSEICLFPL
jgi:hypothetical protein